MKKLIEIDSVTLKKLKIIAAIEDLSVKALMEKAIGFFVAEKEKNRLDSLSQEEKLDMGLLALMEQDDLSDTVSEDEFLKALNE